MLVKNKFKITKTFEASLSIMADNSFDDKDKKNNEWNVKFVDSVKNLDYTQLSSKQKVILTNICQLLRKQGYIR
jgi:hypothetical protein